VTDHALDAIALAIHAPIPADAKRTTLAPLEPFSSWPRPEARCDAAICPGSGANRTFCGRGREV
jgi:hypothetical protein